MKYYKVPASELEKVEESRLRLYKLLDDIKYFDTDKINRVMLVTDITEPFWHVANRKWEVIHED